MAETETETETRTSKVKITLYVERSVADGMREQADREERSQSSAWTRAGRDYLHRHARARRDVAAAS